MKIYTILGVNLLLIATAARAVRNVALNHASADVPTAFAQASAIQAPKH